MADKPSILEQLLQEAMAKGEQAARSEDFPVNLRAADGSIIEGIPLSKVGKDFLAKFGITSGEEGDGDGGTGTGTGQGGSGTGGGQGQGSGSTNPVRNLFRGTGS